MQGILDRIYASQTDQMVVLILSCASHLSLVLLICSSPALQSSCLRADEVVFSAPGNSKSDIWVLLGINLPVALLSACAGGFSESPAWIVGLARSLRCLLILVNVCYFFSLQGI